MHRRFSTNKVLIKMFIEQNAQCFYCGCLCTILDFRTNGRFKKNAASVEHIYSYMDIRRYAIGGSITVMACYECNTRRGREENKNTHQKIDRSFKLIDLLKINT